MTDVVILSDEDCDGLCAAKIVSSAYDKPAVLFQKWNIFGLAKGDVEAILAHNPKEVYILDLGSGMEMLEAANDIIGAGANVTILDNHPPDPLVETPEDMKTFTKTLFGMGEAFKDKFFYDSGTDTCTTGIAYELMVQRFPINLRWALIGLTGDVATDPKKSPRGYALYSHLLETSPYLRGLFMSKNDGASYDFGLLNFFAKLLHVPRRMIFDAAPPLVFDAMIEMEKVPNWIEFNRILGMKEVGKGLDASPIFKDGKNNNLKAVLSLQAEYEKEHGKADTKGEATTLHYPDFDVTILSHKWNLGSALASKRLGMTNKAQFVINTIPNQEIHISGRGPTEVSVPAIGSSGYAAPGVFKSIPGLHIGKVFRKADPDIMTGGGIQPAGSAKGINTDPEVLLSELVKAVARAKA